MLRIQEVCKEKGVTMQILAKKMGITYQALYASVAGNPTVGRLEEIAKALDVEVIDLLERKSCSFTCPNCGSKLKLIKEE